MCRATLNTYGMTLEVISGALNTLMLSFRMNFNHVDLHNLKKKKVTVLNICSYFTVKRQYGKKKKKPPA